MDTNHTDHIAEARAKVLAAALPEVPFDGWSPTTFRTAIANSGVERGLAELALPRGPLDLALAFHDSRDALLKAWLETTDLSHLRYSERVGRAIEKRLELMAPDREAARRAVSFFALPHNAYEGGMAIWRTADTIWTGLGDTSQDINYYTKRATLSGVYSSSVLFWLGDQSLDFAHTRGFVGRRIENVMQFEKLRASVTDNPIARTMEEGFDRLFKAMRPQGDLPGPFGRRR